MSEIIIFDPVNRFFWTLAIIVLFISAFYYLYRGLKKKDSNEKLIMIGFSCIFLGFAFARLFYFMAEYQLKGTYRDHVFYSNYSNIYEYYTLFDIIAPISSILGITIFFFIFDKVLDKTKFLPFISNIILIALIIIISNYRGTIIYLTVAFNGIAMLIILFWFSKHSTNEFQMISILMIMGTILIIFGTILDTRFIKSLNLISRTIPAFFLIAGSIISISPNFIKPQKRTSYLLISLVILLIINILVVIFSLSFILIISKDNTNYIPIIGAWGLTIEGIIVLFYVLHRIIKLLRPPAIIPIEKELHKEKDILSIFSKPERLSEEEVSISIEKKICLICKNTLARNIYLCPKCHAFYCKNCSTILADRENACWICNSPFDASKPIQILDFPKEDMEKSKMKKLALITIIDLNIYDTIEKFKWEGTEKEEFIQYILSLSSERRNEVLKEMIELNSSLNEEENIEDGGH